MAARCATVRLRPRTLHSPRSFQRDCFLKEVSGLNVTKQLSTSRTFSKMQGNQEMSTKPDSSRIHILGIGNLGRLFAHALANSKNPPPISLLFHRQSLLQEWEKAGRQISITTSGVVNSKRTFDVEVINPSKPHPKDGTPFAPSLDREGIISNLVIATKALNTVPALSSIKHRLNSDSTLLFTQNGMGTIEEVTSSIFPDPANRPNYLASVTSHGVYTQGPFHSVHAGFGTVAIGPVQDPLLPTSQYLISKIVSTSLLAARQVSSRELLHIQLEKLVINAMINPLTAIFRCKNGELFTHGQVVKLMRLLLLEAIHVIQSLPEIRDDPDPEVEDRFSKERLEKVVLDVADMTGKNTSSMLQDVNAGRETEIDYINGWIVKKGMERGVDCEFNEKVVEMVKEGRVIGVDEVREKLPGPGDKIGVGDAFSFFLWP